MAQRFYVPYMEESCSDWSPNCVIRYEDYRELEAENARLRQQRDAANAQLDFLLEHLKKEE